MQNKNILKCFLKNTLILPSVEHCCTLLMALSSLILFFPLVFQHQPALT